MDFNEVRYRVERAEKELMPEARLEQYKKISEDARHYQHHLQDKKDAESQKFDQEAADLKPDNEITISDKEREASPEMVVVGERKLDSKNVAVMSYLTKTVMSRMAAEVDTPEELLQFAKGLASDEDKNMRYVLIDSFHEILKAGKEFEDYSKVSYEMREQFRIAKNSLKSPEQQKYEAALEEAETNKNRLFTRYFAEEKNTEEFINEMDGKIKWLAGNVKGKSNANVW